LALALTLAIVTTVPGADARSALVHDFFVAQGGAEQVAVELGRLLPHAHVYTSFFSPKRFAGELDPGRVRTWPIQRLTGPTDHFRAFLPLYPLWFTALDLRRYELVVSSSIAFTKAVRTSPEALHVSYVHTPMRYAWDLDTYLAQSSLSVPARIAARTLRPLLRSWDRATAARPDVIVANSETVSARIRRLWGRESELIYPPVDVEGIALGARDDGFLLVAARMLAYRRLDLAVEACSRLGRELLVVGEGPERKRLEAMAGPSVRFVGRVNRTSLVDLFQRCHAYLVPGVEDFGIAPVEAMAAGKPVISYRAGGAAETVIDGVTGVFFGQQTPRSLAEAIEQRDAIAFDPVVIRARARAYDVSVFRARWCQLFERFGVDPSLFSIE
jgi:glycosyltransferase involved in cell wall biosynthesis